MIETEFHHEKHKWGKWDFVLEAVTTTAHCGECHRIIRKGQKCYVSRATRGFLHGKVAKRICSESCGQTFDLRELNWYATEREERQRESRLS